MAARRLARSEYCWPISRYENRVVSSQKMYSSSMLSEITSPSIDPANATKSNAYRPSPDLSDAKYQRLYTSTSAPTPATSATIRGRQRVEADIEVEVDAADPRDVLGDDTPGPDRRQLPDQPDHRRGGHEREREECARTPPSHEQRRHQRGDRMRGDEFQHARSGGRLGRRIDQSLGCRRVVTGRPGGLAATCPNGSSTAGGAVNLSAGAMPARSGFGQARAVRVGTSCPRMLPTGVWETS